MSELVTGFHPSDMEEPAPTTIQDARAVFTPSQGSEVVEVDPMANITEKALQAHRRKVDLIVEAQADARRRVFPVR